MKAITSALILISLFSQAQPVKKINSINKKVIFEVVMDSALKKKKPFLLIFEKGVIDQSMFGQKKVDPKSVKGSSYFFELNNQSKPRYFSIMLTESNKVDWRGLKEYHFEPGDNVRIMIKPTRLSFIFGLDFSGKDSAKYRCKNEYSHLAPPDTVKNKALFSKEGNYNQYNSTLWHLRAAYQIIEKYKPLLSDYSYNLLHADVLGEYGNFIYSSLDAHLINLLKKKDTVGFKAMANDFSGKFKYDLSENISDGILLDSKEYANFLLHRIVTENRMKFIVLNPKAIYESIKKTDNIVLREKMILIFFVKYWDFIKSDFEGLLEDALSTIKNKDCLAILQEYSRHKAGNKAYNFSLMDVNGKKISLSDFKGKVVFIDFWFTGCTYCEGYYKSVLTKVESLYKKNPDIVFITISLDKNKDTWVKSVKEGEYTSSKAVNLYTNGEGIYNDVIRYYNITSCPRPMLIGRKGEIIVSSGNELRKFDRLKSEIDKALKNAM